jgi:hypothetical protein
MFSRHGARHDKCVQVMIVSAGESAIKNRALLNQPYLSTGSCVCVCVCVCMCVCVCACACELKLKLELNLNGCSFA